MKKLILLVILVATFTGCASTQYHMKDCRSVPDTEKSKGDFLCEKP